VFKKIRRNELPVFGYLKTPTELMCLTKILLFCLLVLTFFILLGWVVGLSQIHLCHLVAYITSERLDRGLVQNQIIAQRCNQHSVFGAFPV
jgi:hypothetical protein